MCRMCSPVRPSAQHIACASQACMPRGHRLTPTLARCPNPGSSLQERETLQAQLDTKEKELEAAGERAEAAERAASERSRALAGKVDALADQVRRPGTLFLACTKHVLWVNVVELRGFLKAGGLCRQCGRVVKRVITLQLVKMWLCKQADMWQGRGAAQAVGAPTCSAQTSHPRSAQLHATVSRSARQAARWRPHALRWRRSSTSRRRSGRASRRR